MDSAKYLILLCGFLVVCAEGDAEDTLQNVPGLRLRVTQDGMERVMGQAFEFLQEFLPGTRLPDIVDDVANVDVKLSNLRISAVSVPEQAVQIFSGQGFMVSVSGIELEITGLYDFDIDFGFFSTLKSGDIRIVLRDLEMTLGFTFGGTPTANLPFRVNTNCDSDASVRVYFAGQWSGGFHFGSHLVKPILNNIVSDEVCKAIKDGIDDVNGELDLVFPLEHGIAFDLSFSQIPTFVTNAYMETHHKGEVLFHGEPVTPSGPPVVIPSFPEQQEHVAYGYVTESTVNAMARAAFWAGMLERSLQQRTRDVLPNDLLTLLDYSCSIVSVCFDDLTHPSSMLVTDIYLLQEPEVQLMPNNTVAVHLNVMANALIEHEGNRVPLVDVAMVMDVVVKLDTNGTHIKLQLDFEDIEPSSTLRLLSLPSVFGIRASFTDVISGVVEAQVRLLETNMLAPIPLPNIPAIELDNFEFIPTNYEDLIVVGTDVNIVHQDLQNIITQGMI